MKDLFRKHLVQDVHPQFMTISGLRAVWEILRGIPFIDWRTELISILFAHLKSKKIAIPVELHGKLDSFLGEMAQ